MQSVSASVQFQVPLFLHLQAHRWSMVQKQSFWINPVQKVKTKPGTKGPPAKLKSQEKQSLIPSLSMRNSRPFFLPWFFFSNFLASRPSSLQCCRLQLEASSCSFKCSRLQALDQSHLQADCCGANKGKERRKISLFPAAAVCSAAFPAPLARGMRAYVITVCTEK